MIELRQPELEALILQRLQSGTFRDAEDVVYQALKEGPPSQKVASILTTADMFAAFQRSPCKEVDLESAPFTATISDPVEF